MEEKLVAIPLAVAALALISISGLGAQGGELTLKLIQIWRSINWARFWCCPVLVLIDFFTIDFARPRENAFCVPLERSAVCWRERRLLISWRLWRWEAETPRN